MSDVSDFPSPADVPGHRPRSPREIAFLLPGKTLTIDLSRATLRRLRAYLARVEQNCPGDGYAPDESEDDSLAVAIGGLLDRGLEADELEANAYADQMTGELRPLGPVALRRRFAAARRAWKRGY